MEQSKFFINVRRFFEKLPGIGLRQANRFIWAILDFPQEEREAFSHALLEMQKHLRRCDTCFRAFPFSLETQTTESLSLCPFCKEGSSRDHAKIMVLEKDSDLLNIERAKFYNGLYHLLGGTFDPLEENPLVRKRIKALYERTSEVTNASNENSRRGRAPERSEGRDKEFSGLAFVTLEIILALSPTKLGEFTSEYIKKVLEPLASETKLKISKLGRGLSTGIELEYADELTLKQALDNRK